MKKTKYLLCAVYKELHVWVNPRAVPYEIFCQLIECVAPFDGILRYHFLIMLDDCYMLLDDC
jgi:hypothetical protein